MKHKELIDQLTLEEKAALLGGKGEWDSRDIPRLNIPSMIMSDGRVGLQRYSPAEHPVDDHVGRPSRAQAPGGSGRSPWSQRIPSCNLFPDSRNNGGQLG